MQSNEMMDAPALRPALSVVAAGDEGSGGFTRSL